MVDQDGEEGLEDIGIWKKLLKVKPQHPCKGVCLRLNLTWILFIDFFKKLFSVGLKRWMTYRSYFQGLWFIKEDNTHK